MLESSVLFMKNGRLQICNLDQPAYQIGSMCISCSIDGLEIKATYMCYSENLRKLPKLEDGHQFIFMGFSIPIMPYPVQLSIIDINVKLILEKHCNFAKPFFPVWLINP